MQTTRSDARDSFRSDEPTRQVVLISSESTWINLLSSESHEHVDVERVAGIPVQLLEAYAEAAVRHARVSEVEAGVWFADIVGFEGVWGEGSSVDMALADLLAAMPDWVGLKLSAGAHVPPVGGFDLNLPAAV